MDSYLEDRKDKPQMDILTEDIPKLVERCYIDSELPKYFVKEPQMMEVIITRFVHSFNYDDFDSTCNCLTLLNIFMEEKEGFNYLVNKQILLTHCYRLLLKDDLKQILIKNVLKTLFQLSDKLENLDFLIRNDVIQTLYQESRTYDSTKNRDLLHLSMKFIEKLYRAMQNSAVSSEVVFRMADPHFILRQLEKDGDPELFQTALKILSLKKHLDRKIVQHSLKILDPIIFSNEFDVTLFLDYFTSLLQFPFSTEVVLMVLDFVQKCDIVGKHISTPTRENLRLTMSMLRLIVEIMVKSNCQRESYWAIFKYFILSIFQWEDLPEHSYVMSLCLQVVTLSLTHVIQKSQSAEDAERALKKCQPPFSPEDLGILVPALEMFQDNPQIIVHVCEIIFITCMVFKEKHGKDDFKQSFNGIYSQKNADLLLLKLANKFQISCNILISIFRAVRGMCQSSPKTSKQFVMFNNFEKWVPIFEAFPYEVTFCVEIISVLSFWFQCHEVVRKSVDLRIHDLVLTYLDRFCSQSDRLVLSAVNIFSLYGPKVKEISSDLSMIQATLINALSVNISRLDIQIRGMRLFNTLVTFDRSCQFTDETMIRLCDLLYSNLEEHSNNLLVKKAVFLALQLVVDSSLTFYQFVIDSKAMDKILKSIELRGEANEVNDPELEHLQRRFFHVLKKRCKVEILNEILFYACEKDYVNSVILFKMLGANINYSKKGISCLKRAVLNRNEELISFILDSGERDLMKDIEGCIKYLIQDNNFNGKDTLIATLLNHFGTSRETGNVVWESIGLGNPKPEWFFKTFNPWPNNNSEPHVPLMEQPKIKDVAKFLMNENPEDRKRRLTPAHKMQMMSQQKIPTLDTVLQGSTRKISVPKKELSQSLPIKIKELAEQYNSQESNLKASSSEMSEAESDTSDLGSISESKIFHRGLTFDDLLKVTLNKIEVYVDKVQSDSNTESDSSQIEGTQADDGMGSNFSLQLVRTQRSDSFWNWKQNIFLVHYLSLSNNGIRNLDYLSNSPKLMSSFSSLKELYLGKNKLSYLPRQLMENLNNLQVLSLNDNCFSDFPDEIFLCRQLTKLDLSQNFLKKLEYQHSKLTELGIRSFQSHGLKSLYFSNNQIREYPPWLTEVFPDLQEIYLDRNAIKSLPSLQKRCHVETMDLSANNLSEVSHAFLSHFGNLTTLKLSKNNLKTLPAETGCQLTKLRSLDVSNNSLASETEPYIPQFILELPWLRDITISQNGVKGFPKPSLWKSNSLTKIRASNNEITELDFSGDLTPFFEINDLYFDKNLLVSIPDQICQLKKLETFDISDNSKIKRIPSDLYRCENLRKFYKSGIQLCNMPIYVQRNDTVSILKYLQERAKQSTPYYSVKMLLMGHTCRGKTTLLRNLINEQSQPKLYDDVTLGIEISEWKLKGIDRKSYKQTEFTINCWDFSGKEDFYATHQVFLTKDAFYMVVYNVAAENIQEELNLVSSWLYNIHARAPAAATFIVGTHLDAIPEENEQKSRKTLCVEFFSQHFYTQKHRHHYAFVGVNCGSTTKVLRDTIRTKLAETKTDGEYFMGRKVPRVYQTLEKIIMKYKDNVRKSEFPVKSVIDSRTVKNLITEEQLPIKENHDLHLAMKFLNTSGTILHFSEVLSCRTLSDIYFLDPKWLCSLIVRLISSSPLSNDLIHNGVITYDGLCMLYAREAPILKIYGKLMENFCILVPLPDNRWLIPSRLPEKPKNYMSRLLESEDKGVIQRIYSLMFLPQGLMSIYLARIISELSYLLPEETNSKTEDPTSIDYFSDYIEVAILKLPAVVGTIEVRKGERSEIVMTVQKTREGRILLGNLIDLFETVLNEWFHGITESMDNDSPFKLFECFAVCSLCLHEQRSVPEILPTRFPIHDLAMTFSTCDNNTSVVCYRHQDEPLSIYDLAPDLTFTDIVDESLHLTLKDLEIAPSVASHLGAGGFGSVYKAKLDGVDVAVKMFVPSKGFSKAAQILMSSANLRKELKLMLRLRHPSILSTRGFILKPRKMLVLELAPHGSLTAAMTTGHIKGRQLKNRILFQIAQGLKVLHDHKIVYMDLKPDNVLIFSLAVDATVNAKIADYGISCHVMAKNPLKMSSMGTIGFRAPEQIKRRYSVQSDIYAFGLVAYYLITNGTHPLGDMKFPRRIENKISSNARFPAITDQGAAPWPDMENLIIQCTMQKEKSRPSAAEIVTAMKGYGFRHLRRKLEITGKELPKKFEVICMTGTDCDDDALRIFIGAEADGEKTSYLIYVDYNNVESSFKVITLLETQVQSIYAINETFILVGTLEGVLYGIDIKKPEDISVLMKFPADAILCITGVQVPALGDWIFFGLASGKVVCLSQNELILETDLSSFVIQVADTSEDTAENPICNIVSRGSLLWLSCGTQLHLYEMNLPTISGEDSSTLKPNFSSEKLQFNMDRELPPIRQLLVTDKYIIISRLRSTKIEVYAWLAKDLDLQLVLNINLTKLLKDRLTSSGSRRGNPIVYIRQLCLLNEDIVIMSLKDGQVVVANIHNLEDPDNFKIFRRHASDVKLVFSSDEMVGFCDSEKIPLVFCMGRGFIEASFDPEKRKELKEYHTGQTSNSEWTLLSWRIAEFK